MSPLEQLFRLEIEFHRCLRTLAPGTGDASSVHASYALQSGYDQLIRSSAPSPPGRGNPTRTPHPGRRCPRPARRPRFAEAAPWAPPARPLKPPPPHAMLLPITPASAKIHADPFLNPTAEPGLWPPNPATPTPAT